jgi:hypothetical protein
MSFLKHRPQTPKIQLLNYLLSEVTDIFRAQMKEDTMKPDNGSYRSYNISWWILDQMCSEIQKGKMADSDQRQDEPALDGEDSEEMNDDPGVRYDTSYPHDGDSRSRELILTSQLEHHMPPRDRDVNQERPFGSWTERAFPTSNMRRARPPSRHSKHNGSQRLEDALQQQEQYLLANYYQQSQTFPMDSLNPSDGFSSQSSVDYTPQLSSHSDKVSNLSSMGKGLGDSWLDIITI